MSVVNYRLELIETINVFGKERQLLKAAEELNELATAILKYINKPDKQTELWNDVAEEMADVEIMMLQAGMILDNRIAVERIFDKKMARLKQLTRQQIEKKTKGSEGSNGK